MTASSFQALLALVLLSAPPCLLAAGADNKTDSEKSMPFVPLDANQGRDKGDASHGPADHDKYDAMKPPGYAGSATNQECQYDNPDYSDCDPFSLKKTRTKNLIRGGPSCGQQHVNETEECSQSDFPPGTQWLIKEHKKCISELEHLKSLLSELHRWIDMIVERGQSLYKAFEDLRKHAEEIQKHIKDVHKEVHDNQVLMDRLVKELEEWKGKARNLRGELDALKAKYILLKKDHERMLVDINACQSELNGCNERKNTLNSEIDDLETSNRDLKAQLMDAEQFKLEAEKAQVNLDQFKNEVMTLEGQVAAAKAERHTCRMNIVKANNNEDPKIDRDTHVNLDMKMWITHNQTISTTASTTAYPQYPGQRIYKDRPITTYAPSTYTTQYTTTTPYTTTTTYTTTYQAPSTYQETTTYKEPETTTYQEPETTAYQEPPKAEYSTPGY